jgi:hypothetical protein
VRLYRNLDDLAAARAARHDGLQRLPARMLDVRGEWVVRGQEGNAADSHACRFLGHQSRPQKVPTNGVERVSLECGSCERDLRGEHDPDCKWAIKHERVDSTDLPLADRPRMTWRCDECGAEFDHFTYGGPCPGRRIEGCGGELRRRLLARPTSAGGGISEWS